MKLYGYILNEETKECFIGNQEAAKELDYPLLDVTMDYEGKWFLDGYVPQKPRKIILQETLLELQHNLKETDYITNKLAEVVDDIDAYKEMKEHYSEQLSQRSYWRQKIREIEEELKENNTNES